MSPTILLSIEILYILIIDSCRFPSSFHSTLVLLPTVNLFALVLAETKVYIRKNLLGLIYSIRSFARGDLVLNPLPSDI